MVAAVTMILPVCLACPIFPGVGISFGVDRIYDVLEEMNLFPENLQVSTKALFFNMGEAESRFAFGIMQKLRSNGIACELYHEAVKINKQFTYAEKKNIPFVIIIGSKEMEEKNCSVKFSNMYRKLLCLKSWLSI